MDLKTLCEYCMGTGITDQTSGDYPNNPPVPCSPCSGTGKRPIGSMEELEDQFNQIDKKLQKIMKALKIEE